MLTCRHCGEPIECAGGVWFHPQRRFRGRNGSLPVLCDFGYRIGPTHAAPAVLTPVDKDFLYSNHIAVDEESFWLEALWLEWRHANVNRGAFRCVCCGAEVESEHALDCPRRAPMIFEGAIPHRRTTVRP